MTLFLPLDFLTLAHLFFCAAEMRARAAYFFAAFNFAHLARCAAAILFLPASDIVRLGFGA